MRFGSVCSGIEAASVAWDPLGWKPAWFSEIEPFPSAVLAHHYQGVTNLGDMTRIAASVLSGSIEAPDVLVGGTPCQAFSMAGLRKSLEDDRGQLSIAYIHLADAIESVRASRGLPPPVVVWENVPGVLSTKDNAFGCFLAGLAGEDCELQPSGKKWTDAGCVYGPQRTVAWRVLDAQYFGLAQRRRRVFIVASSRKDIDPAAILLERDGLRRDTAPSREAGKETAHATAPCLTSSGRGVGRIGDTRGQDPVVAVAFGGNNQAGSINVATARNACASASGRMDFETETFLVQPIAAYAIQAGALRTKPGSGPDGVGIQADHAYTLEARAEVQRVAQPIPFDTTQVTSPQNGSNPKAGDLCHPIAAGAHAPAVAYTTKLHNTKSNNAGKLFVERSPCLDANSPAPALLTQMAVRRLTPVECERLQGFPDGYTAIPWRKKPADQCPDGPRYKALGNSMAVPVMRWIGNRIQLEIWASK